MRCRQRRALSEHDSLPCPAFASWVETPDGQNRVALRCGDTVVLVSVLKPFLFRLSLFSPAAVQGTLISACRRTASRVPRLACCSTLMSSSSEPFLFWRWKRSPPGALPADVGTLPFGSVSRSLPIRCSANSLPACRPARSAALISKARCCPDRYSVLLLCRGRHRLPTEGEQQSKTGREYGPLLARWCRPERARAWHAWILGRGRGITLA